MSHSLKASDETATALADFASEHEVGPNAHELDALVADLAPEDDSFVSQHGVSLFPAAAEIIGARRPPEAERGLPVARDTNVAAKSLAPVKAYLRPLALAVLAVMAVERVTMWKTTPGAAPTENPTAAATDSATTATAFPPVADASAPAAPVVVPEPKPDVRTAADRAASLRPAPSERSIAGAVKPQPPEQPAPNSRPAMVVVPMSGPALFGIAAKAPSVEMLTSALPAPRTATTVIPSPITPVAVDGEILDRAAIDHVLDTYQQSYSALDAAMVSTIWRGLDTRGLQRAFDGLDSQRMSFEHCDVTVEDDKARASCTGVLDYVRKIGQTHPLQKRLSWNFDLERTDDRWMISKVDAR